MPVVEAASPFLIVGLGNYTNPLTRHSVGQLVLDALAARLGILLAYDRSMMSWHAQQQLDIPLPTKRAKRRSAGKTSEGDKSLVESDVLRVTINLVKPKLLMNISGKAVSLSVRSLISTRNPSTRSIIALHDSLDHPAQSVRPKASGSAEGHNGVKSIITSLGGSMNFRRIRLGIGRPEGKVSVDQYVLGKLPELEIKYWGPGGEGSEKVWQAILAIMIEEARSNSDEV